MVARAAEAVMVRGLQTVYITVRQFQRSLEFYRKVLGVRETKIMPWGHEPDEQGAFFELADGTKIIVSYEVPHAVAPRRQYLWLELQVEDPQALFDQLKSDGVPIKQAPYTTAAGSTAFEVTDPDGNDIRIGTRWLLPG
jgi:uncharacterized glyoxalase superfamily protein PhnB